MRAHKALPLLLLIMLGASAGGLFAKIIQLNTDPQDAISEPETKTGGLLTSSLADGVSPEASPSQAPAAVLSHYSESLKRPLFSPTRRPPSAVLRKPEAPKTKPKPTIRKAKPAPKITKPKPKPLQPVDDLRLRGVALSASLRKALVVSHGNEEGTWLHEGSIIRGWTVTSISENTAVLAVDNRQIRLEIHTKRSDNSTPKGAK